VSRTVSERYGEYEKGTGRDNGKDGWGE